MSETTIVILTAMNHEYQAVRKRLSDATTHHHPTGTIFEVGYVGDGCRIALARTGVGNNQAAVTAERATKEFAPAAVIFVGVAYALQPRLRLGDIVVATYVYPYHSATSEDSGLKARPRTHELSYRARQAAEHLELTSEWRRGLPSAPRTGPNAPRVIFGPIAAGEIAEYSATSDVRAWLREHYNDAVAGEMEAAGVTQAGHMNDALPTVVIRGICDYGDASKPAADGAGWQDRAVANAAVFATALAVAIASDPGWPRGPGGTRPKENDPHGSGPVNIAKDNAQVGVQGQHITVNGGIHLGGPATFSSPAAPHAAATPPGRFQVLLMRSAQAFRRVAEFASGVTAIVTAVRSAA
jgi:8-oxo-dGTP diphosphatase